MANLVRKISTKLYQNWPRIVKDMTTSATARSISRHMAPHWRSKFSHPCGYPLK